MKLFLIFAERVHATLGFLPSDCKASTLDKVRVRRWSALNVVYLNFERASPEIDDCIFY